MITNDIPLAFAQAENAASKLIDKYGINSPEQIRVRDIAFLENAFVVEEAVARATASLVRTENTATIRVTPTDQPERQRFSIAHELGHFKLNHTNGILQKICTKNDMMSWHSNNIEAEANFFADELLLPKKMIEKMCDVAEINFKPVEDISKKFRVSLTATAIKFVRLNPEKCAVVYSENGKIIWSYRSPEWWPFIQHGRPLDKRTGAYDFFQGEELDTEPIDVDADAWLTNTKWVREISEHSIGAKQLGFVLSLLWIKPE